MAYSALLLGLVGSLHCFGMCGPISLLVPTHRYRVVLGRLVYNLGRITTYASLGILTGTLGQQLSAVVPQQILFLALGGTLLLYLLTPASIKRRINVWKPLERGTSRIRKSIARLRNHHGLLVQFSFGVLNGLIPCGLVYAALSGAFATQNALQASWFMALFGFGTLPIMMSFGLVSHILPRFITARSKQLFTSTYVVLAVFFLYKGIYTPPAMPQHSSTSITICSAP